MTDEQRTQQPEETSSEPTQSTQTAGEQVAASIETPVVPVEPKPEEIPSTWDDADDDLVLSSEDLKGAIAHSATRKVKAPTALPPGCWVQGPGAVDLMAEGIKLTQGASKAAGTPIKEIRAVHAMALPNAQVVLLKAVREGTKDAIETKRVGKGPLKFNISDLLREAQMEVTSGYREYYPVKKVAESPIGPCIAIVMAKAIKTKRVGEKDDEDDKK